MRRMERALMMWRRLCRHQEALRFVQISHAQCRHGSLRLNERPQIRETVFFRCRQALLENRERRLMLCCLPLDNSVPESEVRPSPGFPSSVLRPQLAADCLSLAELAAPRLIVDQELCDSEAVLD